MFHANPPDQPAEPATPCARCGKDSAPEAETWGYPLCWICKGVWLHAPMPEHEVRKDGESPHEHMKRWHDLGHEARAAAWRKQTSDFIAVFRAKQLRKVAG